MAAAAHWGVTSFLPLPVRQVYVAWREPEDPSCQAGTVILAFRGTSSREDALIDARAWREPVAMDQPAIGGEGASGLAGRAARYLEHNC